MEVEEFVVGATSQNAFDTRVKGKVLQLENTPKTTTNNTIPKKQPKKILLHQYKNQLKTAKFNQTTLANLHRLWLSYINNEYSNCSAIHFLQKLARVDYHGAEFTIKKSKTPSLIGVKGICVVETESCFYLVGANGKLKVVPKKGSWFSFSVKKQQKYGQEESKDTKETEFVIYGTQFKSKPWDRIKRKFEHNFNVFNL